MYKNKTRAWKKYQGHIIKYKEIIFGADSPICIKCLDEPRKQHVIDKKMYDQKLIND